MDLADQPLDTRPPSSSASPACPGCGRTRTADARDLAWSTEHAHDGTVTFVCPGCTRADITQIEAGLPCLGHRSPAA